MNDAAMEQKIQKHGLTAPRVTPDVIAPLMNRVVYITEVVAGTTTMFVHAFLDEKFYLGSGHSACVDLANFNWQIGEEIARPKAEQAARNKLWEMEGYRLYRELNS